METASNKKIIVETCLRYLLGLIIISYGILKIALTQFVLPPEIYEEPLKNIDGVTLTWAFLGYSKPFTILIGLLELIPGLLLLFRRTKLLGAVLLLPILINVFAINLAFDFISLMQGFTFLLLLMNIALLSLHFEIFVALWNQLTQKNHAAYRSFRTELTVNVLLLGSLLAVLFLCIWY